MSGSGALKHHTDAKGYLNMEEEQFKGPSQQSVSRSSHAAPPKTAPGNPKKKLETEKLGKKKRKVRIDVLCLLVLIGRYVVKVHYILNNNAPSSFLSQSFPKRCHRIPRSKISYNIPRKPPTIIWTSQQIINGSITCISIDGMAYRWRSSRAMLLNPGIHTRQERQGS